MKVIESKVNDIICGIDIVVCARVGRPWEILV